MKNTKLSFRQKEIIMKGIMFLVIVLALAMTACNKKKGTEVEVAGAKDNFEVTFLFEKDGCKVYRFVDGRSHYFTNCTETISTKSSSSGKTATYWQENIGGRK